MTSATTTRRSNSEKMKWTLATALGLSIGIGVAFVLGAPIEAVVGMMLVTPVLTALAGSILGSSQWLVLRHRMNNSGWWIVCTAIGLSAGLTLGIVLVEKISAAITGEAVRIANSGTAVRIVCFAAIGLCAGLGVGAAQWFYLRRRTSGAGRWLASSGVGFMTGFAIAVAIAEIMTGGVTTALGLVVFLLIATTIAGGITSKGLDRLVTAS